MGVLQRFERRLGNLVEGAFARVFKGVVEPVEVAGALQREAEEKKAILGPGRILVPNEYVVELGRSDNVRLSPYAAPLCSEFAAMVREHAEEQQWSFVGPVQVRLEENDELDTGVFRIRSGVGPPPAEAGEASDGRRDADRSGPADSAEPARAVEEPQGRQLEGRPRLVVPAGGTVRSGAEEKDRVIDLRAPVTVIGRSHDVDVRLDNTTVSRRHAEVRLRGDDVVFVDLGSTNGSTVNGRPVTEAVLHSGDRLELGTSMLAYHRDPPADGS